jgi:F-type H+-transporting ATPase subunit b
MAAPNTVAGTVQLAPVPQSTGLPQMDFSTFPSQLFWLAVSFGLLFIVLSRVAVPRIAGVITERRNRIEGDLGAAERLRQDAANALQSYEAALANARARAHALADENRKRTLAGIDQAKAKADTAAQAAITEAERRIAADRSKAAAAIRAAAAEAAADIVERLIGERVAAGEVEAAIAAGER